MAKSGLFDEVTLSKEVRDIRKSAGLEAPGRGKSTRKGPGAEVCGRENEVTEGLE
jgi:hypothetical protein